MPKLLVIFGAIEGIPMGILSNKLRLWNLPLLLLLLLLQVLMLIIMYYNKRILKESNMEEKEKTAEAVTTSYLERLTK
jgi:cytochrome c-type biogenesis protein CcmH/NrfF